MKRQRKTALWKDAFREVRKTKSRFFSIFLIVALGAGFFAGIKATGPDMKLTGDAYFDEQDLMDIKALSTYGLNGDDIAALEARLEENKRAQDRDGADYEKLQQLMEEQQELEEKLEEKTERWMYLTDLAERIQRGE